MDTTLLADALDQPIHEGDLILDDGGRVYFVAPTENSFLRQGFLRVYEAHYSRGYFTAVESHSYAEGYHSVKLTDADEVPVDVRDRRRLFWQKFAPAREARIKELQQRHALRRL